MFASRKAGKSIIYIHIYNEINIASAVLNSSPAVLAYFSSLFKLPRKLLYSNSKTGELLGRL